MWINGGYFVLRRDIFDFMQPGDELVEAPFRRLIAEDKLWATGTKASGRRWIR